MMDSLIPDEMNRVGAREGVLDPWLAIDPRAPLTAVSGAKRYGVLRIAEREVVVESAGRPPMRGTVDLFAGAERVARLLVQFAWERDGRAAYEIKRRAVVALAAAVPHGARGKGGAAEGQGA
ncbi:MAG: hypothetical protein AAFY66_05370 [Pseudomonadota bacterium]